MPALVSILIPAYNAERWLPATLRSAVSQTWPASEVIVIDDGSQDATLAIARAFESRTVKVVSQPNMGAAAARNRALELAQGSYIQWLDADDLLAPEKVKQQMMLAERIADPRVLYSSSWAHFMYRQSAARFSPTPLWDDLSPVEWVVRKWTHNVHMQTATWLVSRQLSETAGPWNTQLLGDDDGEYFARVVLASRGVRFVAGPAVYYRIVDTARLSHIGSSTRKLEAQLRSMQLQIGYLRALEDSPRVRAAVISYLQTWLPHFYPERPDLVDQMKEIASSVGGQLRPAHISSKFAFVDRLFGRAIAKRIQYQCRTQRTSVLRSWDRLMFQLSGE